MPFDHERLDVYRVALEALDKGSWAAPTSEPKLARTVTRHLKAYLAAKG